MKWTSALAIYFLFWSFSIFLVLPFGVRTSEEAGEAKVPGQADSAPHRFEPGKVALRVTVVATILFGLYYLNYVNGWIGVEALDFFTNLA
jgi:predicted secreted protein